MARSKGRKKKEGPAAGAAALDPGRAGMPARDSIRGVKQIERGGKVYRIIKTDERDEYDEPGRPGRAPKR